MSDIYYAVSLEEKQAVPLNKQYDMGGCGLGYYAIVVGISFDGCHLVLYLLLGLERQTRKDSLNHHLLQIKHNAVILIKE